MKLSTNESLDIPRPMRVENTGYRTRARRGTRRFSACLVAVTVAPPQPVWSSVRTARVGLRATRTTAVAAVTTLQADYSLSAGEENDK